MLLSTHVRPSIILPACELAWTFLVMGIAGAKTAGAVSFSKIIYNVLGR